MNGIKKAFVLAGGTGTRLRPFTYEIPKPLLPVKGRPVLEYNLINLKAHGVKEVVLGVGYKSDLIREYFGSGKKFGLKLHYNLEERPLGTAGALKQAEPYFDSSFFMCNGDEAKNVDYSAMHELHKQNNALATIALVETEDASAFGAVEVDGELILSFKEKQAETGLVSAGAYVLEKGVFDLIPAAKNCSIEREIFPLIAKEKRLFGYRMKGQWFPADNPERYEKAIKEWRGITESA